MKWFQREDFIKMLKKMERELKVDPSDFSFYSDHQLQKHFQKLHRVKKTNIEKGKDA